MVSVPFGLYDMQAILDSQWAGVPFQSWPGLNFTPGIEFWALLPAFIVVTMVGAVETVGDGVAIQQVSHRRPRATDFRVVQGALNADGVGNLLSGLLGTLPNTTYSSSVSLTEVTGIAARACGIVIGVFFILLAFFPKATALLIAIPSPVAAAYITVLLVLLFVQGMRMIIQDGVDHRKAVVVGLGFWIGVGFQNQVIFPEYITGFWSVLLDNGMTAGAIVTILLMFFIELTGSRSRRLAVGLSADALPELDAFLRQFASANRWEAASAERLAAAGEETLSILLHEADYPESVGARRMSVSARMRDNSAELEFVTALEGDNMEDRLAYLNELPAVPDEREGLLPPPMALRLLRPPPKIPRHRHPNRNRRNHAVSPFPFNGTQLSSSVSVACE